MHAKRRDLVWTEHVKEKSPGPRPTDAKETWLERKRRKVFDMIGRARDRVVFFL